MQTFAVDNFSKFIALVTLGVPPRTPDGREPDENSAPEWREISSDELEKNGFANVEAAEKAGFVGTIAYGVGEHADRKRIGLAFDKAHYTKKENLKIPDTIDLRTSRGRIDAIELLATFSALLFRNRKFFNDRRTKVRAKLRLKKGDGHFAVIDRRANTATKERFSK